MKSRSVCKYWSAALLGSALALASLSAVVPVQAQTAGEGVGVVTPPTPGVPAYINNAVSSWSRFREDVWNDPVLKPALIAKFIGIKPGDKVADFDPHHMYWSRLFTKIVGLKGHVYPFVPQLGCRPAHPGCHPAEPTSTSIGYSPELRPQQTLIGDPRFNGIDEVLDNENIWDFSRNMSVIWNVGGQFSLPEQLDVVWSFGHWHNLRTWDYAFPMPYFLAQVYESVKPGGVFAIGDYASAPGRAFSDVEVVHRVDKEAVKAEVIAAGFEFVGESNVLENKADDHTKPVDDNAVVVPKNVDMFLLKFRKPLNAKPDRRWKRSQYGDLLNSNLRDGSAPPNSGGGIFYNADGTYQEYNAGIGRWFMDAHGNLCLWNEFPRAVRGVLGCHPFKPTKFDQVYDEPVNRPEPAKDVLRREHSYVSQETAEHGNGSGRTAGGRAEN